MKQNRQEEAFVMNSNITEAKKKVLMALVNGGFTKVVENDSINEIGAEYRKGWGVYGKLSVALFDEGDKTKLKIVATALQGGMPSLFKFQPEQVINAFKSSLTGQPQPNVYSSKETIIFVILLTITLILILGVLPQIVRSCRDSAQEKEACAFIETKYGVGKKKQNFHQVAMHGKRQAATNSKRANCRTCKGNKICLNCNGYGVLKDGMYCLVCLGYGTCPDCCAGKSWEDLLREDGVDVEALQDSQERMGIIPISVEEHKKRAHLLSIEKYFGRTFEETECLLCHGSGRCSYCAGRGHTFNKYDKTYPDCDMCHGGGNCRACYGAGTIIH